MWMTFKLWRQVGFDDNEILLMEDSIFFSYVPSMHDRSTLILSMATVVRKQEHSLVQCWGTCVYTNWCRSNCQIPELFRLLQYLDASVQTLWRTRKTSTSVNEVAWYWY